MEERQLICDQVRTSRPAIPIGALGEARPWHGKKTRRSARVSNERTDPLATRETTRAFALSEIRILDSTGEIERAISFSEADRKL
jgi:hypothetical protein